MIIEERVDVAAAPERVWAAMRDVERWPEWTPTVTSVERLDDRPFGVGSRFRIRQPKLPTAVWTVTALEPGRYVEWRNASPGLTSVGGHRVTPAAGGATRVTLTLTWSGWLTPLIRLFYGKLSRRYVRTEADTLKRRSESAG
jgi:uncharacterized membrane protein